LSGTFAPLRCSSIRQRCASGTPWKYYDLGYGYCTYDFFDQCPHRMACAKCSFYQPKDSTAAFLVEGKNNLLRMRQEIPLGPLHLMLADAPLPPGFGATLAKWVHCPRASNGPLPRRSNLVGCVRRDARSDRFPPCQTIIPTALQVALRVADNTETGCHLAARGL
jgi:hypothetical protein